MKSCTSGKANASPPESNRSSLDFIFINQLRQLKMFIQMEENVIQEGIFRKTGSASRQKELRALIQSDKLFELTESYTVYDCATVFKSFLAELHEPVLTDVKKTDDLLAEVPKVESFPVKTKSRFAYDGLKQQRLVAPMLRLSKIASC